MKEGTWEYLNPDETIAQKAVALHYRQVHFPEIARQPPNDSIRAVSYQNRKYIGLFCGSAYLRVYKVCEEDRVRGVDNPHAPIIELLNS